MKYAILGGGGAFGIHTAFHLLDYGAERIIGIGRSPLRPEPFSLGIEREERFTYHVRHIVFELDMLFELLDKERPEVIINFAAQGEGAASWQRSWTFFQTNAMALSSLVEELSKRDWLKHFIHISSSEVYGSNDHAVDEDAPIRPTSPYAASKVAFDYYLQALHARRSFPMTILRPSNAYCPGQLLHRVIPRAVVCGLTGRKLPLHGGGHARKSYIHARDLARAILLVSEHEPQGSIYNVGPPLAIRIRELMGFVAVALGVEFDQLCETADKRPQDACYWLDSQRIADELGWRQGISLTDGIDEMVAWGRRYIDQLRDWPTEYILRA